MYFIKKQKNIYKACLPIAVPINQKYNVVNGKNILSKKYRGYKNDIAKLPHPSPIPKEYVKRVFQKNVIVEICLYEKDNRRDVDACVKIIFDVLNGKVWEDDSQIWSIIIKQYVDKDNPRVQLSAVKELRG